MKFQIFATTFGRMTRIDGKYNISTMVGIKNDKSTSTLTRATSTLISLKSAYEFHVRDL